MTLGNMRENGVRGPYPLAVEMPRWSNAAAICRTLVTAAAISSPMTGSKCAALPLAWAVSCLWTAARVVHGQRHRMGAEQHRRCDDPASRSLSLSWQRYSCQS
jgi:hypothetical protein